MLSIKKVMGSHGERSSYCGWRARFHDSEAGDHARKEVQAKGRSRE